MLNKVLCKHRKNIVNHFAQIRMLSDIRYDIIIYFARASHELIFYVIYLNVRYKNITLKKKRWNKSLQYMKTIFMQAQWYRYKRIGNYKQPVSQTPFRMEAKLRPETIA